MANCRFEKSPELTGPFKTSLRAATAARSIARMRDETRAQGFGKDLFLFLFGSLGCLFGVSGILLYVHLIGRDHFFLAVFVLESLFVAAILAMVIWAYLLPGSFIPFARWFNLTENTDAEEARWGIMKRYVVMRYITIITIYPISFGLVLVDAALCTFFDPYLVVQAYRFPLKWSLRIKKQASAINADPRTLFFCEYAEHTAWWDRRVEALQAAADRLAKSDGSGEDSEIWAACRLAVAEADPFIYLCDGFREVLSNDVPFRTPLGTSVVLGSAKDLLGLKLLSLETCRQRIDAALGEIARLEAAGKSA